MTVEELIEELRKAPAGATVYFKENLSVYAEPFLVKDVSVVADRIGAGGGWVTLYQTSTHNYGR